MEKKQERKIFTTILCSTYLHRIRWIINAIWDLIQYRLEKKIYGKFIHKKRNSPEKLKGEENVQCFLTEGNDYTCIINRGSECERETEKVRSKKEIEEEFVSVKSVEIDIEDKKKKKKAKMFTE